MVPGPVKNTAICELLCWLVSFRMSFLLFGKTWEIQGIPVCERHLHDKPLTSQPLTSQHGGSRLSWKKRNYWPAAGLLPGCPPPQTGEWGIVPVGVNCNSVNFTFSNSSPRSNFLLHQLILTSPPHTRDDVIKPVIISPVGVSELAIVVLSPPPLPVLPVRVTLLWLGTNEVLLVPVPPLPLYSVLRMHHVCACSCSISLLAICRGVQ